MKNRPNTFNADGRIGTVGPTGSTNGEMYTGERVLLQLVFAVKGPGRVGGGRETVGCRVTTGGCVKICVVRGSGVPTEMSVGEDAWGSVIADCKSDVSTESG